MPLDIGSVVRYVGNYHDVDDDARGRVCKKFGAQYFWVNFSDAGCILVKATSLQTASGNPPDCTDCPD